jgi:hypothetical protein
MQFVPERFERFVPRTRQSANPSRPESFGCAAPARKATPYWLGDGLEAVIYRRLILSNIHD